MTTKTFLMDSKECDIALKIENLHKSKIYHMFLGWRETIYLTKEIAIMRFIFTKKDLEIFKMMLDK